MSNDTLTILLIIITLWLFLSYFFSYIGGWHKLAQKYKAKNHPYGKADYLQSAKFGFVVYSHCLTIRKVEEGLFISISPPIYFGMPTLFLPWSDITLNKDLPVLFPYDKAITISVGTPAIAKITLASKYVENIPRLEG